MNVYIEYYLFSAKILIRNNQTSIESGLIHGAHCRVFVLSKQKEDVQVELLNIGIW
jgi:hypothetical protein